MKKQARKHGGGVSRQHGRSRFEKIVFIGLHFAIIVFCVWLVHGNGITKLGLLFGTTWQFADPQRANIALGCAVFYWLRHNITIFYLLKREIKWSEVFGLLAFMAVFEIGFVLIAGGIIRGYAIPIGWLDMLGFTGVIVGAYLNSFSEIERKWWKKDPTNKGHCYTQGLFKHAMHINYFGDVVLFTGWALLTANLWALALPALMLYMFIFMHIPALDRYLTKRYGKEFETYAEHTKKLIPFIY
ncbi:MAG: hypothetical protein COA43_12865 [Robiginitomaculum sp.]|nr:MAG: hypothetical protein COA43_12865 [Robiginitomaculum sp.]